MPASPAVRRGEPSPPSGSRAAQLLDALLVAVTLVDLVHAVAVRDGGVLLVVGHLLLVGLVPARRAVAARHQERSTADLRRRAGSDPLTGLANRTVLRAALRDSAAHGPVALLLLDLDGFKAVNDASGHAAGDRLLVACASRLRYGLRAGDTLARVGGDEFAAVLPGCGREEAVRIAVGLLADLTAPGVLPCGPAAVGASIGISLGGADAGPNELLAEADLAMYAAKAAGKGRVEVYRDELREQTQRRFVLDAELRRALDAGEVDVQFQPIVLLDSGRTIGVEALARWSSPTYGAVGPAEFVAVAEETGLITRLGCYVLEQACATVAAWVAAGIDLRVGVNVSPRQLDSDELLDLVQAALRSSGLEPERLVLEVTEGLLVHDDAIRRLTRLRDQGVRIAVDDFGTGYSSLSYLRRLPLDIVKLDRSFLRGMADDPAQLALIDGVLLVCDRLGLDVVAEGIETNAEHDALVERGCRVGQGYLFARPQPAAALSRTLLPPAPHPVRVG